MATAKNCLLVLGDVRYSAIANLLLTKMENRLLTPKRGSKSRKESINRLLVMIHQQGGRRKAEALAAEYAVKKDHLSCPVEQLSFGEALDRYIEERSAVLSPSSIRKYRSMRRNCMVPLNNYKLQNINQDIIQDEINKASSTMSPKSVRDMNGLISAVVKGFYPGLALNITLPKKQRNNIYIPTESDIKQLVHESKGTNMEVPILLAAFGAMRRGEICALQKADIKNNTVHVTKTMVMTDQGDWIIKAPKSYAGDRYVTFPAFVIKKVLALPADTVNMNPNTLTSSFGNLLKKLEIPHFRFHDLRHYNASVQHALGIPDAYIMQSGGWGNDSVLKEVYRHTLPDMEDKINHVAINYFESMQHEMQHKF